MGHCLIILNPNTLVQYFSNFSVFKNHCRSYKNSDSDVEGLELGSRFFISNKFPDDIDAIGLKTILNSKADRHWWLESVHQVKPISYFWIRWVLNTAHVNSELEQNFMLTGNVGFLFRNSLFVQFLNFLFVFLWGYLFLIGLQFFYIHSGYKPFIYSEWQIFHLCYMYV